MAKVLKKKNGDYVIINDLYEEIPVKHVDVLYPFHNNIATFRVTVNKEKMFGYMNTSGEKITKTSMSMLKISVKNMVLLKTEIIKILLIDPAKNFLNGSIHLSLLSSRTLSL
ncbi:MAG: hypothetical protein MJ246_03210 [Clostridia bacterium]|nr:hypothetical protein [Clostridia bacterium]